MKNSLLTIVVAVYNDKNNLEKTLESIYSQIYTSIEVIIVDGGSTDGSLNVVDRYISKIDSLISEPDSGIYDAMNKGMNIATGSYILFFNAGEVFCSNNVLSNFSVECKNNPLVDIFYASYFVRGYNSTKFQEPKSPSLLSLYFWGTRVFCHQAIIVKLVNSPNFDTNYKWKGELDWYFKIFKSKPITHKLAKPFCYYSLGGAGDINFWSNLKENLIVNYRENIFCLFLSLPVLIYKMLLRIVL